MTTSRMVSLIFILGLFPLSAIAAVPVVPVGYWSFEEGSGPTVNDISGNRHAGTLEGGAVRAKTDKGWCLNLNGSDAYVDIRDTKRGLDGMTQLTIEAQIYLRRYPPSDRGINIVDKWGPGYIEDDSYALGIIGKDDISKPGYLYIKVSDGNPNRLPNDGNISMRFSDHAVPLGKWCHVMATWAPPNDMHLYINGTECSGEVFGSNNRTVIVQDTSTPIYLGRSSLGGFLDAAIDEVSIYENVLTSPSAGELPNAPPTEASSPQ